MTDDFDLKVISSEAIPRAIEKAEHYRLLNDPSQAESICLDVLAADPKNQRALIVLILALTDQFIASTASVRRAREFLSKITQEYEASYYAGIVSEREGRALLARGMAGAFAYGPFRDAMDWYEKAQVHSPEGNPDPVLRWNGCARTIMANNLEAHVDDDELPLE